MRRPAVIILGGWIFILLVMAMVWPQPLMTGALPDTDDYMRMVRVFDILDGNRYPSYEVPRLGVGGSELGWSRLVDWPLAAVQGTFETFLPRLDAAMMTATLAPALALLAFLAAAFWYARPMLGDKSPLFVIFAVFLLWGLLRQFMPGRVDHHMIQATLGVLAYGALLRIWFAPDRLLYPLIAGAAFATGLAIGADIIPWLFCGAVFVGIAWLVHGESFEKPALFFGAAVFAVTLALHALLQEAGFWTPSCDSLSVVWLSLATALSCFWAIIFILPATFKNTFRKRILAAAVIAAPMLAALYFSFPSCFSDPHQIENSLVRDIWLAAVMEARSLPSFWAGNSGIALFLTVPSVLALTGTLWASRIEKENRALWLALALILFCGLALTSYQVRTADFALAASVAPLAWLFGAIFARLQSYMNTLTRRQRLAGAGSFFAVSLVFFIFAATDEKQSAVKTSYQCSVKEAAAQLNVLPGPLTIAAYIDAGSELLFRTGHNVLAAPYHRNEQGIMTAYNILTAPDQAAARTLMTQNGADIIMICNDPGNPWTKDSLFARALLAGTVPEWLEQVGEKTGGYLVFKVVR